MKYFARHIRQITHQECHQIVNEHISTGKIVLKFVSRKLDPAQFILFYRALYCVNFKKTAILRFFVAFFNKIKIKIIC